jgi:hypothetical protein
LAVAPILGLAALGVMALTRIMMRRYARWSVQLTTFALITLTQVIGHSTIAAQPPLGYRSAFKFIDASAGLANRRVLVVSDEFGEGAAVAEAAVVGRHPRPMILRGSKVLATGDWMGNGFALRHQSPKELLLDLEAMQVDYVLLDESSKARGLPYWQETSAAMTLLADHTELVSAERVDTKAGPLRPVNVYRLKVKAPGAPQTIELSGTADRSLRHLGVNFSHLP